MGLGFREKVWARDITAWGQKKPPVNECGLGRYGADHWGTPGEEVQ